MFVTIFSRPEHHEKTVKLDNPNVQQDGRSWVQVCQTIAESKRIGILLRSYGILTLSRMSHTPSWSILYVARLPFDNCHAARFCPPQRLLEWRRIDIGWRCHNIHPIVGGAKAGYGGGKSHRWAVNLRVGTIETDERKRGKQDSWSFGSRTIRSKPSCPKVLRCIRG